MPPPDQVRVQHMLDAARKAVQFAHGRSRADLDTDEMYALATVRLLEIIGEAASNVSQPTKDASPHIPWRQIAGARNRLIHGYFTVNHDVVWQILAADLPTLIADLQVLLPALGPPPP